MMVKPFRVPRGCACAPWLARRGLAPPSGSSQEGPMLYIALSEFDIDVGCVVREQYPENIPCRERCP